MNMASIGFCIFTAIFISAGNAQTFIKVQCKTENIGQYGAQSLLECEIHTSVENVNIKAVTWRKDGVDKPRLVFYNESTKPEPGYSFAESSWNKNNMNVSLLITNTAVKDEGVYTCQVMSDSGSDTSKTTLKVTAKYSAPTINPFPTKIALNMDGTLVCKSDGGYPKGQLRWFGEHNTDWTKSAKMEAIQTESGLYELSSKLPVLRGSIQPRYTCVVFNASGGKEDEATIDIPNSPEEHGGEKQLGPASKIVAPVVVIGSLIVGLLVMLIICRRRSQQARRQSATPLMGGHEGVRTESDVEDGGQDEHVEYADVIEKSQDDLAQA